MCGIVGGIAHRDVVPVLMEGLKRLEYRGYDSAGVAVLDENQHLQRIRSVGKVSSLKGLIDQADLSSKLGIAHTRWATHGMPSERNAHPHMSGEQVAIVHNGIIENYADLREELTDKGFVFTSETDTEVIAHLLADIMKSQTDIVEAVRLASNKLIGAYALAVVSPEDPDQMVVIRAGSPLVIGLGDDENFIASDVFALLPVTQQFIFLEEGDLAHITREKVAIADLHGQPVEREVRTSQVSAAKAEKGPYRHYMLKEIFEQPAVIAETLEGRIHKGRLLEESFGHEAKTLLDKTRNVHIVACGTSFHAGLVARYWLEEIGIHCSVEVASEFRYREVVVPDDTLFVTISQSGETADTLAALRGSESKGYLGSMVICNVPESSLVRESNVALMTRAGPEIGVASTKAFTTQLVALRLFTLALAKRRGMSDEREQELVNELHALPRQVEVILKLNDEIKSMANAFAERHHALFLGRGCFYPIAMEGALKLKEISYIHAEAYPAGELKHGPLALVDAEMPVICALPDDPLLEKVISNLQEVRARGGELFLFSDHSVKIGLDHYQNLTLSDIYPSTSPIVYSIPLQLLAYHVAILKGTDVDQPRNLAKSVTVE
ncbi:MAG: glutamine--fructose-6-phosphate transaminase (isomerizing) [Candidatus Thiodiazotropha weberae]|uniref:Glutamine--fructose-6-phosphate aminotransferase [isomerizing] n=1 Tax=Candidatus Thiodiazotropha endoloripes TaxID=1818881 RepID=A0A1E2UMR3_9GAMM|nr:glutamine--fructose-6-phosphate transaminase (isomerizing) [Candidatus Thiodiazotropha endoloripes]MCG7900141.1 glutamine--fructose-6-phosphate transaminase (isomerizing) [Candidatus Thiodiazotropha weberae]MCG7902312.1 glutamine--fructose-6-phosphate transaminase (isomerizing) [Candidatus Thiodiazotropha weberae]MCG7912634.1 glutamine--fructose-6-phosphate transaminase (isomerizing) [Candidatus Thiodiazotropha weberae]ODB84360.1 glutamine--fructose-6-phosphate aminotransferase [Candidatus T